MSSVPPSNILLPAEIYVVTAKRGIGDGEDTVVNLNNDVYNNMGQRPNTTVCARTQKNGPWTNYECVSDWGWQLQNCTDMLPFNLLSLNMSGQFLQISNEAKNRGIRIGTSFTMSFHDCSYNITFVGCESERGSFSYNRATDYSLTNGGGGNYRYATIRFNPVGKKSWNALLIARQKFEGIMETAFGIATFELSPIC